MFGCSNRRRVWQKPKVAFHEKTIIPNGRHGVGNVMVWDLFPDSGTGQHTVIASALISTSWEIALEDSVRLSVQKCKSNWNWTFQPDNNLKHTATSLKNLSADEIEDYWIKSYWNALGRFETGNICNWMYFANFQLSTVRDRWTILQNTYRKSAKWVISEAKGIITSPTEEYYIYKFFVHYNIEKANSNCSSILPLSRPCIKEACLLVNIFQKDSKCSFTFFFHHSIYGVKGS